jgi:DNA polymerase-3 subunit delta
VRYSVILLFFAKMAFDSILSDLKTKNYKSMYLLHGEESYYIDQLVEHFLNTVVPPESKDFDLSIMYGKDSKADLVVSTVKRFPMMGEKHLVVLREAQMMPKLENIAPLIEDPVNTSILVIAHKGKVDQRKKWVKDFKKVGTVFASTSIPDWDMPKWIAQECRKKGYTIDQKGAVMLNEFLGNDLARIVGEIDKLGILLKGGKDITPALIEKNIGISRDYNIFELQDALLNKDILKVNTIIKYYGQNPNQHPMPMLTASLYSFYTKLILVHAHKAFSPQLAAQKLGVKPFYAGKLIAGAKNYTYGKLVKNIEILATYDLKSKGVGAYDIEPGELMKEMFFRLLH